MNLFIDLETIPTQREDFIADVANTVSPPGNMKKAETIEAWEKDKKPALVEKATLDTVFDGGKGELITFGFAIDNEQAVAIQREPGESEGDLLYQINNVLEQALFKHNSYVHPLWIGHNITGYDLRFLWKRFVVNGIKPAVEIPHNAKPWDKTVYDTMVEWAGFGKDEKNLDFVCRALNLKGKDGFDGSMVYEAWKAGEYKKIAEYCQSDVELTREVYNRLTFRG